MFSRFPSPIVFCNGDTLNLIHELRGYELGDIEYNEVRYMKYSGQLIGYIILLTEWTIEYIFACSEEQELPDFNPFGA